MPTLNWIGKERVVNYAVPFHVLERVCNFGGATDNKIIHGDNLLALKSLLPEYEGRVKCVYIDPPYNTGNEGWIYNDRVNAPQMKRWLGEVVGREGEDLSRHDKWLCMMYPRLKLLKRLLADDGAIFISIDDNEQANLKLICDEIFGAQNFVASLYIQVRFVGKTLVEDADFQKVIETILIYRKTDATRFIKPKSKYDISKFCYRIIEKGTPAVVELGGKRVEIFRKDDYEILKDTPSIELLKEIWATGKILDGNSSGRFFRDYLSGRTAQDGLSVLYKVHGIGDDKFDYRYFTGPKKPGATKGKYYQGVPVNLLTGLENFTKELPIPNFESLAEDFGNIRHEGGINFRNGKKPTKLLQKLISYIIAPDDKNSIVLDSFAGSGTTAHAVLKLNAQDGGNRTFILVEMEDYAERITAERVRRVIDGYGTVAGTGGGFDFYEVGEPLMIDGDLNEAVDAEKIRAYIWYTETRTRYIAPDGNNRAYLGEHDGTAIYFRYERGKLTTLDAEFLRTIERRAERYLIYADECALSDEFLRGHAITFKKIPRDIKRSDAL
ncbi:MAG: site-specific DNA-methyltransferase [Quinella sp. 1Q7]|nr:site-specific DNA-methyltransferase [Quinella sp. 1Q7]